MFPPQEFSGYQGKEPTPKKKMEKWEGTRETTKYILGWLVDGKNFTLQLMREKCEKIEINKKGGKNEAMSVITLPRYPCKSPALLLWDILGENRYYPP